MNKAVAWSIKGVDFDAREAAREAADRAGMTLGEWMNEVISERAAELGASPDDFDDEDRLSAVAARLSRMSRLAPEKGRRRVDQRRMRDTEETEFYRPARRATARTREREISFADGDRAEALFERAIDSFERRAHRSSEKTARAIADMANMIETAQERATVEGEALHAISDRLAEIERRIARSGEKDSNRPIRGALTRLESRLEELSKRSEAPAEENGMREIEDKLSEIAARLEKNPSQPRTETDRLSQLESRIAALSAQIVGARAAPERRPFVDAVAEIAARQRQLEGSGVVRAFEPRPPFDVRRPSAPSEVENRLASVVERLERKLDQPPPPPAQLVGLQSDIARMANHIEQMREDFARRAAAPAPLAAVEAPLDQIRREIGGLTRALGDLAPRASVAALERAVRDVSDQLEAARSQGAREINLAPMEQLAYDLRASLRQLDQRGAFETLERDVRAISAKLDNLENVGAVDPQTIAAIHDQTRDMRDLLSRAAAAIPTASAQRELTAIADKIAHGDQNGAADMARLLAEIRAIGDNPGASAALKTLEQRLDMLATRIDAALEVGGGAQIAAFGERLDMLQRAVAQSLAVPRAAPAADMRHIEALVGDLAERIERAAAPGADQGHVAGLQRQVERLAAKLEGTTDPAVPLASIQRAVTGIFEELEATRRGALDAARQAAQEVAHEAAQEAARAAASSAARETMREALAAIEGQRGLAADPALVREIADLRNVQGASEQRNHATLTAVHETLERMVNRMAALESDIARPRPAPAPRAAAVAPPAFETDFVAPRAQPRETREPRLAEPVRAPATDPSASILIEPGVGANRVTRAAARAGETAENAQAGFIAAARRAAMAAQSSAAEAEAIAEAEEPHAEGRLDQARAVFEKRKRPILLGLAAVVMMLGAYQVAGFLGVGDAPQSPAAPKTESKAEPAQKGAALEAPKAEAGKSEARSDQPPAAESSRSEPAKSVEGATAQPAPAAQATQAGLPPPPSMTPAPAPQSVAPAGALPTMVQPRAGQRRVDVPVDSQPVGAIERADPRTMSALQTLAARGDLAAQYDLGARYADHARDYKNAARWFEKSAAKGLAPAQYRLGVLYERGLGVARDPAAARGWYQRAAERGNARAMHNLAVLLADGGGAKPEYSESAIWFRRAAEFGVKDSQYNLAILYARGMGLAQDMVESYAWFSAAAAQGDADSAKKRDEVAGRLDAKSLARAKEIAAAFKPRETDPAANEVASPALDLDRPQESKPAARPKVSRL